MHAMLKWLGWLDCHQSYRCGAALSAADEMQVCGIESLFRKQAFHAQQYRQTSTLDWLSMQTLIQAPPPQHLHQLPGHGLGSHQGAVALCG
jgi:hypothetical protein